MNREGVIKFEGSSDADANIYASELRQALLDASADITVELRRANPESQNFGDILQVVLAAPAIVIAAKALRDWLILHNSASIEITTKDGTVMAKNLTSKDAASLPEKMRNM